MYTRLKWFLWLAWHPCGWQQFRDLYFDIKTAWLLSQMIVQNTRHMH